VIAAASSRGVENTEPVAGDGAMAATTQLHTNANNTANARKTVTVDRRLPTPFGATKDTTPPGAQAKYQPVSTNR
jgi:hypothetical protein